MFLLFIFLFNWRAHADDLCKIKSLSNVDMRAEFGPIRDQGNKGWCFAYTSADILGHWLKKNNYLKNNNGTSNLISAGDIAIQSFAKVGRGSGSSFDKVQAGTDIYSEIAKLALLAPNTSKVQTNAIKKKRDKLLKEYDKLGIGPTPKIPQAGVETHAIRRVFAAGGPCLESDFPTAITEYHGEDSIIKEHMAVTQQFGVWSLFDNIIIPYVAIDFNDEKRRCDTEEAMKLFLPNGDLKNIGKILNHFYEVNPALFLASAACKRIKIPKDKIPKVEAFGLNDIERSAIITKLDAILSAQTPVSIAIMPNFITEPEKHEKATPGQPLSLHAAVIVGRNYNCEHKNYDYIVRNSWGPNSCKKSRVKIDKPLFTCTNDGHYIIPSEVLKDNLDSIAFLN